MLLTPDDQCWRAFILYPTPEMVESAGQSALTKVTNGLRQLAAGQSEQANNATTVPSAV